MSKFKVGDKVRILDGSKIENYTGKWNALFMKCYVGEVHTIEHVKRDWTDGRVSYKLDDTIYVWDERGLELVSEQKSEQKQKEGRMKIVITTDGRITKARLYDNEKFVRQAVARCASDDKFDFNVGAGLAFTKLMGTSPITTSLDWDKFAHGKLAVKVNKKTFDAFVKQCEQKDFTWEECGNSREVNPWKMYDEMPSYLKVFVELIDAAPNEHIYISVVDGDLKWDNNKRDKDSDEYEFI